MFIPTEYSKRYLTFSIRHSSDFTSGVQAANGFR